jgi:DNA repair exonuclease SbcCD ATPase subunit
MISKDIRYLVLIVDENTSVVREIMNLKDSYVSWGERDKIESLHDLIEDDYSLQIDSLLHEAASTEKMATTFLRLKENPDEKYRFSAIRLGNDFLLIGGNIGSDLCERVFDEMMLINNEQSNLLRKTAKELAEIKREYKDTHLSMYYELSETNNELANAQRMLAKKNAELESAMQDIELLSKMIPICSSCKKIRDDDGFWQNVDSYISERSKIIFSHSICPDCKAKLYPELNKDKKED